ncbi:MerR family transcriptional regulator [Aureibaculum marinum]|uniref:MerR family transcriptional regulator n=1 Tax=Aureibaculum marinum TaxID=2487930 RepID=A0A3N4NVQ1_9FLAO|nr:chaperone modulator CbpM [Aureibaculum marinum]RPD99895.1 MerR family transcriptional regulator [Aureibaculum marinum]
MDTEKYIAIEQFCTYYNVPTSFLNKLNEYELVEIIKVESRHCVAKEQISDIEKLMRLHFDLDINMEGLDVINKLLKRVEILQQEITTLNNRLSLYENN